MNTARAGGLLLGVVADAAFGDPQRGHPVAAFGRLTARVEHAAYRDSYPRGAVCTTGLAGAAVLCGAVVERATRAHPVSQAASTALATWATLGGASLAAEGTAMAEALHRDDLAIARARLGHLCGRDPDPLDTAGLTRATVESVAENTSDAVVAPLVWGAVAGIPGLLGYRAVNTLDAMLGHRSTRYARFGWAAARLDDAANLLPARLAAGLTAAAAPLVGGTPGRAWRTRSRDASAHPSPNAGHVEAAFAGALGVRLGGPTPYRYGMQSRPGLGWGPAPRVADIARGVRLSRLVAAGAGLVAAGLALRRR